MSKFVDQRKTAGFFSNPAKASEKSVNLSDVQNIGRQVNDLYEKLGKMFSFKKSAEIEAGMRCLEPIMDVIKTLSPSSKANETAQHTEQESTRFTP